MPHFDYCSVIWGTATMSRLKPIIHLQKRAARVILCAHRYARTNTLFSTLKWLPFNVRVRYHRAVMVYKCLNNMAPDYMCDKFKMQTYTYHTRSQSQSLLVVPKPKLELFRNSFEYQGAAMWNDLPLYVRQSPSLASFRSSILRYLKGTPL